MNDAMTNGLKLHYSPAVREALSAGLPVVALESTIVTHGMPWPANLETAQVAEQAVRDGGATPATIAIIDGAIHVGVRGRQLERLARETGQAVKCSLRDLAIVLARGQSGGTTVAATMLLAHRAGIRVFATGGIGGVHRGAEHSMDISADLKALGQVPLAVVCAGPKAILDLGLTLEALETLGVPVVAYRNDSLPAFWSRSSSYGVDARVESPEEIARLLELQITLGTGTAVLACNPVPESVAIAREALAQPIEQALAEAQAQGVTGKQLTPFLLERVMEATGGESLATNQALMTSNAGLAAAVAVALSQSQKSGG